MNEGRTGRKDGGGRNKEINEGRMVLPGLDNGSCLGGPVRPLRLVVCVISSLPSARLSPEGSHMLSYLCICIILPVTVPACIAVMSVTYTILREQALTCPSRSCRYLCVVMFWSYLTITGNAPSGQSHLCHPFIYGSPASPLLSRTPITKYISSCKVNSSTSTVKWGKGRADHTRHHHKLPLPPHARKERTFHTHTSPHSPPLPAPSLPFSLRPPPPLL